MLRHTFSHPVEQMLGEGAAPGESGELLYYKTY